MARTVVHYIDTAICGGAERMLLTLLSGLDRQRWRPVLFHHPAPGLAPLLERARQLGITTRALPRMQARHRPWRMLQFVRALRMERPAVFHAHLSWPLGCRPALVAAAAARTPVVVATQHLFIRIASRRGICMQRLIARGVDRYIAVSAEVARGLRQNFGLTERQVSVIHNGIPLDGYAGAAPAIPRASLTDAIDRPVILTVARLHEQKGHDVLLDAAALVPDATFVLAGDGPRRDLLEARARQRGLAGRVRFLGARDDVPALLAAADVFVLPSLYEGLPLSVLEAMAAAKPIVATAIGGTDEAVTDGVNGLLVPPGDAPALAAAIGRLLRDPAFARQLALAGHARVHREFSADVMVSRVSGLYEALLDGEAASGST